MTILRADGDPRLPQPVHVRLTAEKIMFVSLYNETVIEIMRANHCRWDRNEWAWVFRRQVWAGELSDRAADIISQLLLKKFMVRCDNAEVVEKVAAGSFEPLHPRWIMGLVNDQSKVAFTWLDEFPELTTVLKMLPGARLKRHNRPGETRLLCPTWHCRELEYVAQNFDFRVTSLARQNIDLARAELDNAVTVAPVKKEAAPRRRKKTWEAAAPEVPADLRED